MFKRLTVALLLLLITLSGTASADTVEIPPTGQFFSYAAGDDAALRRGVTPPLQRFWDRGGGTVIDNLTGLMWTKNANLTSNSVTWQGALDYVAGMNNGTNANYGHTDWRLPNRNELRSLIDYGQYNPALPTGYPLSGVRISSYWTSTTYANDTASAWIVKMSDGALSPSAKTGACYVWAVRDAGTLPTGTLGISGKVMSAQTGSAMIGIPVSLSNGTTATTDQDGNYSFSNLAPGWYTVEISIAGYYPATERVDLTQNVVQNLKLSPVAVPTTGQFFSYVAGDDGAFQIGGLLPPQRFWDRGDGTVIDNLTGLMWTKSANLISASTTWQGALDYVAGMNNGTNANYGHTDWRLPNRNELRSLIDYGQYNPALPAGYPFSGVRDFYCWTSTTYASDTTSAWTMKMFDGTLDKTIKTGAGYAWAVRDAEPLPTGNLSISGKVTSAQSGAALAGVTVSLSNGAYAVTDANGNYTLSGLVTGCYQVMMTVAGYNAYFDDILVSQDSSSLIDIAMAPVVVVPRTGQITSYAPGDDGAGGLGVVWPAQRFTDNGDGTILDNLTGLIWTQSATQANSSVTWQAALTYIAGMNNGSNANFGFTNWRLPNRNELRSLIDYSRYNPALSVNYPFIDVHNVGYWSSTTYASSTVSAWTVNLSDGSLGSLAKTGTAYVWAVRDTLPPKVTGVTPFVLTYGLQGSGLGTLMFSSPRELAANINGSALFCPGTKVTLDALPAMFSLFTGWSGICINITGSCAFSMNNDTSVTATFNKDIDHSVMIDGATQAYYPSIFSAYTYAISTDIIKAWGTDFVEDLTCNSDKNLTLKGGYDMLYTGNSGYTTIKGKLIIRNGSLTVERLVIQ